MYVFLFQIIYAGLISNSRVLSSFTYNPVETIPTALPQQVIVHFGSDQWLPAWQQGSVMSLPVHGSYLFLKVIIHAFE